MDIRNLDWKISNKDLKNILKNGIDGSKYVYGECSFWGKECFATFFYSELPKQITKINISFFKTSGPNTEAVEFKKSFNILKDILGEPFQYVNIDPIRLDQLKNVYKELSYEKLPKIIWELEGKKIVHQFRDRWGMIPDTYIEEIRERIRVL